MNCKICETPSTEMGRWTVLGRHEVMYFRCPACRFVQVEEPFWLDEAYRSAIVAADVGGVGRNQRLAEITHAVIASWFDPGARFLDYGGGYGLLVRLMRDRGFDFRWQDRYVPRPLHCEGFEAGDQESGFDLVTAFELAEHLPDPVAGFSDILARGHAVLFSTELVPASDPDPDEWWYFVPEFGQHVSLYSRESLDHLARRLGVQVVSNGQNLHLLSRRAISPSRFRLVTRQRVARIVAWRNRRPSLVDSDFVSLREAARISNVTGQMAARADVSTERT